MIQSLINIFKKYEGKTYYLILNSSEGISMDQLIRNVEVDSNIEDEVYITLTNNSTMDIASISLYDNIELTVNDIDEVDKKEGSIFSFNLEYDTGTEIQIEIMEN